MDTIVARSRPLPQADINWDKLDKGKYYGLTTCLNAGLWTALLPVSNVVRKGMGASKKVNASSTMNARNILKSDGFYRGFGRAIAVTIPSRATYLTALETTKLGASNIVEPLKLSEASQVAIANGAAGAVASVFARALSNPFRVLDNKLTVQDGVRKVLKEDGVRGLYRGFGLRVVTLAPTSAVWWATYGSTQHQFWRLLRSGDEVEGAAPSEWRIAGVQGTGGVIASVTSSCFFTPLHNISKAIKREKKEGAVQVVRDLVSKKGWGGLYRNIGLHCCLMTIFRASFIVPYEYTKRLSAKEKVDWTHSTPSAAVSIG